MKSVTLPGGEAVPAMGRGTWKMGERAAQRSDEIAALRAGVELGLTLIDTAEMSRNGAAEALIAEALGDVRDQLFLVSKAYPRNASRARLTTACEAGLKRLGTDRLDLYLLHWRGPVPLAETIEALSRLGRSDAGASATLIPTIWTNSSPSAAGAARPIRSFTT